jgi:hypothetical protein
MLKGFYIVIVAQLGFQHALTLTYKWFLDDLEAKENFDSDRIEKYDPTFGPARLLRFVQLLEPGSSKYWTLRVIRRQKT